MRAALLFLINFPAVWGIALAFGIATARWFAVPSDRRRCEWALVACAFLFVAPPACELVTMRLSALTPHKLDLYIYHLDMLLGGEPAFFLGRLAQHHMWLQVAGQMAYGALPCAVLAVWATYLWRVSESAALSILRTFAVNLVLAVPIYLLLPVCGPAYAFPHFPFAAPSEASHYLSIAAPPNGIPSVHTSTALLILFFAWRWRAGRILGTVYLLLILFATMASGQHYALDLVIAVPYTIAVLAIMHVTPQPMTDAIHPELQFSRGPAA